MSDCVDQVLSEGEEVNKELAQMEVIDETKGKKEATETKTKKKKKTKKKSKISYFSPNNCISGIVFRECISVRAVSFVENIYGRKICFLS